ncbi:lysophospholipase-like protein 1 [Copidosoma floridanum]|uniref:lysophospholipase-like protein 1 n=1 Tax=Copidosoma floridanum TaxID=29053 RepID=UPI0006C9D93A|nr:lysophospholipase-like protein 1 [Copidosoma floridanum]
MSINQVPYFYISKYTSGVCKMYSQSSTPNVLMPRTTIVKQALEKKHTATLFLFHGSGSNGEDFKQWLDILNRYELRFPHLKIVYVTAPIQPYTPNGGMPSHVWFNRSAISICVPELRHSINLICNKISELIHREVSDGTPIHRIAVGGFSMGGCLATHLAYRVNRSLAGCIVMSSFLNVGSSVYETLTSQDAINESKWPQLLQFHGTADKIVPLDWGKKTFDNLQKHGVQGTFVPIEGADHEIVQNELSYIKDWLSNLFPVIE